MLYIERNRIITDEIAEGVRLKPGEIIGESKRTRTQVAGSYYSSLLNQQLFLALKTPIRGIDPGLQWINDMAAHAALYDQIPVLRPELPAFFSLVKDRNGNNVGYLTEDFSQGNRYKVEGLTLWELEEIADVAKQIVEVFRGASGHLSDEELVNMFFNINKENYNERRIGDVNRAMQYLGPKERNEKFPISGLLETQALHTLSLD